MKKVAKRQSYSVPILMRALDILEFLRASDIPLKPDEISNVTGVSRTTTYRILHTFSLRGYVAQDAGGRFSFLSVPTKSTLHLELSVVQVLSTINQSAIWASDDRQSELGRALKALKSRGRTCTVKMTELSN